MLNKNKNKTKIINKNRIVEEEQLEIKSQKLDQNLIQNSVNQKAYTRIQEGSGSNRNLLAFKLPTEIVIKPIVDVIVKRSNSAGS